MDEDRSQDKLDTRTLSAAGAFAFSAVLLGGGVLWYRFGELVYVDRLLSAIANCF